MIIRRQGILLSLLKGLKEEVSSVAFQKILFLYANMEEEDQVPRSYDFLPAERGCYSYTARMDKSKLIAEGAVVEEIGKWKLMPNWSGWDERKKLDVATRIRIDRVCRRYGKMSERALMEETYKRFPWYAIRSKYLNEILAENEDAKDRVLKAAVPEKQSTMLFTIGYEGLSLEQYFSRLIKADVRVLCDVRRNPFSHKLGFSKKTLSYMCEKTGIEYLHLPELGIPSDRRTSLNTQKDYDALFAIYEKEDLPKQELAINRICDLLYMKKSVALTCSEFLPEQCHRTVVARAVSKKADMMYSHLFES